MKIKPIFITTIAKDTYNVDGSLWLKKGTKISFSSKFDTSKFGKFTLLAPNPVHLFMENVDYLIKEIEKTTSEINKNNKIIVFSKLVDGVKKYTTDELIKLDPAATQIRSLDESLLYKYLFLSASCLVSMISAIEAWLNQEIPNDYKYTKTDKNGKIRVLTKKEVEVVIRLEEKIELVSKNLGKSSYKQKNYFVSYFVNVIFVGSGTMANYLFI